jgi:prolyl 4-hydroxylase
MSSQSSFRWRTIVEVAAISVVIYIFLGAPGLSSSESGKSTVQDDVPLARAKVESLVYPDKDLKCPRHELDVHIFSASPLVVYLDGFLNNEEAEHLIDIRYIYTRKSLSTCR